MFLKWLREDVLALPRKTDDFCEAAGLQLYYNRQIAPLMARYSAAGPADKRLKQLNTEGMDYYIGMALDTDEVFGSKVIGLRSTTWKTRLLGRWSTLCAMSFPPDRAESEAPCLGAACSGYVLCQWPSGESDAGCAPLDPSKPIAFKVAAPGYKRLKAVSGSISSVVLRRGTPRNEPSLQSDPELAV